MMAGVRYISYLLLFCVGLLFTGCREDVDTDVWDSDRPGDVTLSLKVSIGNTFSPQGTRTLVPNDNPFVPTDIPYELMHTLRIIIVRADNTVEYNQMVNMPVGVGLREVGELQFKVSTSLGELVRENNIVTRTEDKRIYLVANEASIPNEYVRNMLENLKAGYYQKVETTLGSGGNAQGADVNKETYVPGDTFLPGTAEGIMIYNNWPQPDETLNNNYAVPMVDNQGSDKSFVPMSEFFDIPVTANLTTGGSNNNVQKENLFITRNLVKFQFELIEDGMENLESFQVTDITFSSLRQKEYLFPNVTTYSPAKYNPDGSVNMEDKIITGYNIPGTANDENLVRDYVFKPENFGYTGKLTGSKPTPYETVYNPQLYFCESKTLEAVGDNPGLTNFKLSIGVDFYVLDEVKDEQGNTKFVHQPLHVVFDAKDLELPEMLPRNTIVKVRMKIQNGELKCEVTVFPYTGVYLNPSFGFIIPATGITLESQDIELQVGDTISLGVTVEPEDVTDRTLAWSSSDESVASVDSNGNITALSVGTAVITVKIGEFTGNCNVTVTPKEE